MASSATGLSRKRKSDAGTGPAAKKTRSNKEGMSTEVQNIIGASDDYFDNLSVEDLRAKIVAIATYARSLEEDVEATKPKELSDAEVDGAADKLSDVVNRGIKKQMSVRYMRIYSQNFID
jgi:hypothetical protein